MVSVALPAEHDQDAALLAAVQRGDRYALEEFLRRNERWVRGVVFGVSGDPSSLDDVMQRIWIRVWQQSRHLRDAGAWRGWLYRIAANAAMDARRARRRRGRVEQRLPGDALDRKPGRDNPERRAITAERHAAVLAAIRALPVIYREPIVLRLLEGWSYRRIGETLGLGVDTVETRLVRARRMLRESLTDKV